MDIYKPCTECGCVKPHHDAIERATHISYEIGTRFRKLHALHAEQMAVKELALIEAIEGAKWLQNKVHKQAAAIRRLEEKLRTLKVQPYGEEK